MYIFRLSQLIVSRTSSIYISYGSVNLSIHHVILSYDTFHRSLLLLIRFNLIYVTFIVTSTFVLIIFEALLRLNLHTKYIWGISSYRNNCCLLTYVFIAAFHNVLSTKCILSEKVRQVQAPSTQNFSWKSITLEGKVCTVITVARLLFIWQANFANEFCMNSNTWHVFSLKDSNKSFTCLDTISVNSLAAHSKFSYTFEPKLIIYL